jgi:ankyrin repeat protein
MLSPADISPPYFHTGFPYGHDEFLSYAGTTWAAMALLSAMPAATPALRPAAGHDDAATASWLRTALFGTVDALTALVDRGLDVNSKTAGGTTALMAAALDAEKTRLLLARGADARARGRSGIDALTIAASHVGTSAVAAALLDAGAEAQPPADVHARPPLVGAALAGDVDLVRLLLRRGAKPSAQAASEAITFGHADVIGALVEAGADVSGVDRTGVNLLHWAAITNRAAVVPILAKAGVPVNALDDHGYTPLMYAATVDQGDTATLNALLRAGADVRLRNDEGRTALQQARRLKHDEVARALEAH